MATKEAKIAANAEVKSQIDVIDTEIFTLQMKDRWSSADIELHNELCEKKERLIQSVA